MLRVHRPSWCILPNAMVDGSTTDGNPVLDTGSHLEPGVKTSERVLRTGASKKHVSPLVWICSMQSLRCVAFRASAFCIDASVATTREQEVCHKLIVLRRLPLMAFAGLLS